MIIIDNFLTSEEYDTCWNEIQKFKYRPSEIGVINRYPLYGTIMNKIVEPKLLKLHAYPNSEVSTNLTRMDEVFNPSQAWHQDISGELAVGPNRKWGGWAKQWLIYFNYGNYTGGNLQVKEDGHITTVKPFNNRLVVINVDQQHKVDSIEGYRYALNGFVYNIA